MALASILAIAIGVALGLLGGGGSIITVPVLVYAAKIPAQSAVAMSLAIVGATSLVGALIKWREGTVHARASVLFSTTGIIGAVAGAQLTSLISPRILLLLFAALMFLVAMLMLMKKQNEEIPATAQCRPWRCASAGAGVGLMTGFLGVGGGFLIVPALMHFGRIPLKKAIGTSLAIIAVNSFAGLIGHFGTGGVDWKITGLFLVLAMFGMFAGNWAGRKVPKKPLSRGFAFFVIAVAIYVVVKNWA